MKNFNNIFLIACVFIAMQSCEEVLETQPLDKFSEANVWSDPVLTQGFIYDAMNDIYRDWLTVPNSSTLFSANDLHTDNQIRSGGGGNINTGDYDKFYNAGWNQFGQIRQANLIIEKVNNSTSFSESQRTNFIAQGHMLRAMIYSRQARFFGKYTIIDKVLTIDDDLLLGRSETIKDTYDFILSDLTIAANGLPDSGEPGTLTKGSALALKAEMALQGAAYVESGKDEYYQIAKQASEDLFGLGYQLDTDYAGMFNTEQGGINSTEMILAYYRSADNTRFRDTPMQRIVPNLGLNRLHPDASPQLNEGFSGWNRISPTWSLVTNYLVVDEDGVAKKWNETSYYQDYLSNGGYVSNAIFKNRDERFYASIVHDSSSYFGQLVTFREGGNLHWTANTGSKWGMSPSGFHQRKGLYEAERLSAGANTAYHYPMFRLGRSYLNYAETMLRLNQPSVAIEYINKTRVAHGKLPELSTGLGLDDAWKYYKIERRVELFFENDRYWSLLRWGKEAGGGIIDELNTNKQTFVISADGMSFELLDEIPNGYDTRNKMNFSVKRYLFPVPEGERQLNEKLDQNPGW
ncbi:RagB/SusD family nutrient uptake outer membrane protein [Seonamhaeicola marinus]|uniref:RagB/SusD family nutrient uptake outer membrane protein n=1 Tax=Seonamhaeicola marinus TaxID=1912246 RepID=A0A5D0J3U9_9FLAO|nr:RagB/SusD family nutrient uptake outer membrane protein [Seonamhaeicola marinus]TYA89237.1 RagB/SusD family nutrient uptake outer membrane protein [Seonamhaeicola marinus]